MVVEDQPTEQPHQNGATHEHDDTTHRRQDSSAQSLKRRGSIDRDAQEMVIDSLRVQIQDLFSQVSQLNNKLVKSYDRVSDLEDDLHVASANVRASSLKISQLELERTQHLAALNTGLLVEKSHVTAELSRLMEKATEEAAQRGQAESARMAIEKDLDDLSASLFDQANSMVAEARYEKHLSEKKVESAEQALKSAEEAIQLMQVQMQALQAEREQAEKKTQDMEMTMGKGKWIARRDSDVGSSLRLLNCHGPYHDFMAFIAHLRVLHPSSPNHTPAMSTLLQLPFLARLLTEDSEPTVRLDLAPSLNWLSRRSVLSAIHSGQLIIEPLSVGALFAESATQPASVAGVNSSNDNISCALCGISIFPTAEPQHSPRPPIHPLSHTGHSQSQVSSSAWSGSFFKRPLSTGNPPQSPTHSIQRSLSSHSDSQIFVFRLAQTASTGSTIASSLPIPSLARSTSQSGSTPIPISASQSYSGHGTPNLQSSPGNQTTTLYPLCMSGWCLNRLRTTCTMWAFIRTGIVDKIWEEELPPPPPPPSTNTLHVEKHAGAGERPPIPPRKRGIWGIASAIGERAASWGDSDKDKKKAAAVAAAAETPAPVEHRRVPPPLPPVNPTRSSHPPPPPPLPKRNEGRGRSATPQPKAPEEVVETNVPATVSSSTATTEAAGATATTGTPKPLSIQTPPPPPSSELPPVVAPLSPIRRSHLRNASSGTPPPPLPLRAVRSPPPAVAPAVPTSVPLPESRPDTPAAAGAGTAEPVSRTGSPAVATINSTAGGGAPPPIPRRAAARAVRGTPGGSRPSTPANGDATTNTSPTAAAAAAAGGAVTASVNGDDKAAEETKKVEGGAETKDGKADVGQDVAGESGLGTVADDGDKSVDEEPASASATSTAAETAAEKVVVGGEENKEEEAGKGTEQDQDKEKEIANQEAIPDRSSQASPSSSDVFVDALSPGQEVADPVDASASALSLDSVSASTAAAAPQSDETAYEAKENNTDKEAEGKKEEDDLHEAEVDDNDQATIAASQTPVAGQHTGLPETDAPEQGGAALTSDKLPNGVSTSTTDEHVASQINGISQADPAVHVNGVVEHEDAARAQTKEVEEVEEEKAGMSEEKAEEERRKKEQDEKDRARFVGESTWEERTWKEVVRLREDMFWARIGGIRD